MMSASGYTSEDELRAVVAQLPGQRLASVVYYPLTSGDDGLLANEWDFGDWHEPTQGVELITDTAKHYSAIWNNSFYDGSPGCDYRLELFAEPMTTFLAMLGEPGGSVAVPVSDHPRWAPLLASTLVTADICWADWHQPLSLRLATQQGHVWIAAGEHVWIAAGEPDPPTNFYLGIDAVMVIFTDDIAARAGIPEVN